MRRYSVALRGLGNSGGGRGAPVRVGELARQDPIVAYASVWASELLRLAPAGSRVEWLREQLNRTNPGLGNEFVSQYRLFRTRPGKTDHQAVFDGLRLVLANTTAAGVEKYASARGLSGLGSSDRDITAVFCGVIGIGGTGSTVALAATNNPDGAAAVGATATTAMQAAGCNQGALAEQARIAEANARVAEANAAARGQQGQDDGGSNVGLIVGVGAGVLVLGLLGVLLVK
jgi:hypothetical protein